MQIGPGYAVLITGAASGIGKALALALAQRGASISVVDLEEENGLQTLQEVKEKHAELQLQQKLPAGIFVKCDVTKSAEISSAFNQHDRVFGRLDACINCAGIAERGDVLTDKEGLWRQVIEVNLNGVIECTRHAVEAMRARGQPGTILNIASAAGLIPTPVFPIYSTSKAGIIMFTKSLLNLHSEGIRANALCPEFVETPMTKPLDKELIDYTGGFIPMDKIVDGAFELMQDKSKAGACLWISTRLGSQYWRSPEEENMCVPTNGTCTNGKAAIVSALTTTA